MGGTTVLPPSRFPRRTAAIADIYLRTPRIHLNPACMANPASPKKPKRPSSVRGEEPPAKRARGVVGDLHLAAAVSTGSKKRPCPTSEKDPAVSTHLDASVVKKHLCPIGDKDPFRPPSQLPEGTAQAKQPSSIGSMRELIEKARQAKARPAAEKAAEIERHRMEARQMVERIVATVEFNDPFLDPMDVFMSPQQLMEAREAAAEAQARIIAVSRRREMEALK